MQPNLVGEQLMLLTVDGVAVPARCNAQGYLKVVGSPGIAPPPVLPNSEQDDNYVPASIVVDENGSIEHLHTLLNGVLIVDAI